MGASRRPDGGKKGRAGPGKAPGRKGRPPSIAPLAFDPFTPGQEHPEWVRRDFPSYVEHHDEGLARSVRTLESEGRLITLTTTYEVRVNGRRVVLHIMADEEGQVWSHLCPYLSFASALELVQHLLERMPHLFEGAQAPGTEEHDDTPEHPHR